jgi:quercetin dioxygenase-like cupin family protein
MKTRSENFVFADETPWESGGEGIRRQILGYDGQLMLVRVEFQKGAVAKAHEHFHSQSSYIAGGVFEFHVDGEKQILKTGDGIYIAPNVHHGATCLEAGIVIDTFSPVREDFLNNG